MPCVLFANRNVRGESVSVEEIQVGQRYTWGKGVWSGKAARIGHITVHQPFGVLGRRRMVYPSGVQFVEVKRHDEAWPVSVTLSSTDVEARA